MQAQLEQGVLTVAIPVAEHAQPRRIQVTDTGSSSTAQSKVQAVPSADTTSNTASAESHS